MNGLYQEDLAYIQAAGFGDFARGAAPEIVRLLRSASTDVRRVVDLGCGAGPLSAVLVEVGFEVTGIEVSKELLKIARGACPASRFIHGSIYDQRIPACEAILAIGEPLTYNEADGAEKRVREFFQRASEALPRGGMLIFDLIELGEPSLSGRSWKAGEDWAVLSETEDNPGARLLVRNIETFRKVDGSYRRGREVHRVRLFDRDEVSAWLEVAGFNVVTATSYGEFRLAARRRAFFCTRRAAQEAI